MHTPAQSLPPIELGSRPANTPAVSQLPAGWALSAGVVLLALLTGMYAYTHTEEYTRRQQIRAALFAQCEARNALGCAEWADHAADAELNGQPLP